MMSHHSRAIVLLCLSLPMMSSAIADNTLRFAMPALINNQADDRLLLREVSNDLVYPLASVADMQASEVSTAEDLSVWEYLAQSRRITVPKHPRIQFFEFQHRRASDSISEILHRASPFVGYIVGALDKRFLPIELALLPAIESAYRPNAISSRQAAGLWQFMPTTASHVGIRSDTWFDGRLDTRTSTIAAMDYLSSLNAEFHGDWLLTLAAYNAGPGRVREALRRNLRKQLPVDFWSLNLPQETRDYVPKYLALLNMLRRNGPAKYNLPKVSRGSGFDLLNIGRRTSLDRLASLTGVNEAELRLLNAALMHNITPPRGPHYIYVPDGYGTPILAKLAAMDSQSLYTTSHTHQVVAGDTLSSLARAYGVSQKQIMETNALSSTVIKVGQELLLVGLAADNIIVN